MTGALFARRVLVTGAGGFIASHLVEALVRQGARVRAFVRYNSRGDPGLLGLLPEDTLSQVEIVSGDLRDADAVLQAASGMQTVFHLGALIAIPYSYLHPMEVVETNVLGTLNVLMAARQVKSVERVVHTSTSEVYGTAQYVPIDEAHPLQGQSPYSASKIGADKLAESFYCAYEVPVVTVRPFNTYGPRQSTRAVIPTIITQVLKSKRIRLGNLEARRDFTYVADTVSGFLKAGDVPGIEGQAFNLGAGKEVTIKDLAELIMEITGRRVEIEQENERLRPEKSEVQRLVADNGRARTSLDWQPMVPLREGLAQSVAWIEGHLNMYRAEVYQR